MGAQPAPEGYEFRDHGSTIQLQLQVHSQASDLVIRTSGDSLTIVDTSASRTLLKVVQLYSTVDANATEWTVADGTLTVTLKKLESTIQWMTLDAQAAALPEQGMSEAQTGRALQERDRVKILLSAAQTGNVSELQAAAQHFAGQQLEEVKDGTGKNALHFAAQLGQTEVCHYLLTEQQVDVNVQDEAGASHKQSLSRPRNTFMLHRRLVNAHVATMRTLHSLAQSHCLIKCTSSLYTVSTSRLPQHCMCVKSPLNTDALLLCLPNVECQSALQESLIA